MTLNQNLLGMQRRWKTKPKYDMDIRISRQENQNRKKKLVNLKTVIQTIQNETL